MREDFFKIAAGLIALFAALLIVGTLTNFDQIEFEDAIYMVGWGVLVIVFGRYAFLGSSPRSEDRSER